MCFHISFANGDEEESLDSFFIGYDTRVCPFALVTKNAYAKNDGKSNNGMKMNKISVNVPKRTSHVV